MRNGISGGPLPNIGLEYAAECTAACAVPPTFSPVLVYAIKINESGLSDPPTVLSGDGGHGLMQLTSSWPRPGWDDPYTNFLWAIQHYLLDAETYWARQGMQGDDLVRCIAAEYNAGRGGAMDGHNAGNVDLYTTNNYAARALANYQALVAGHLP